MDSVQNEVMARTSFLVEGLVSKFEKGVLSPFYYKLISSKPIWKQFSNILLHPISFNRIPYINDYKWLGEMLKAVQVRNVLHNMVVSMEQTYGY